MATIEDGERSKDEQTDTGSSTLEYPGFPSELETTARTEQLLDSVRGLPFSERLERLSAGLLGVRYIDNPIGEGPGGRYDSRPLFRLDAFDCQTYVETALALAWGGTVAGTKAVLRRIRYDASGCCFTNRHHFLALDWKPANCQAHLLKDVTERVAQGRVTPFSETIDKGRWYSELPPSRIHRLGLSPAAQHELLIELRNRGATLPPSNVSVDSIELSELFRRDSPFTNSNYRYGDDYVDWNLLGRIPNPSVLGFVAPRAGHISLFFRTESGPILRHGRSIRKRMSEQTELVPMLAYWHRFTGFTGFYALAVDPVGPLPTADTGLASC